MPDAAKPYRKHVWEAIDPWPTRYSEDFKGVYRPGYERCEGCCVTRTAKTEDEWCGRPRGDGFAPFPYPEPEREYDPWDVGR